MVSEKEVLQLGLSTREAEIRLKKYGLNTLKEKEKISPVKIFLEQFNDVIIWVLIVATVLSGLMGEKADAITIFVIIVINGTLGFIQEYKTEKSLESLKNMAAPTAKVMRDGKIKVINAMELVIGDVILIESGDRVPADSIILDNYSLMLDESLLTGESVGVNKSGNGKNKDIYMGTIVLKGKAMAKIIATGMNTEMGKIAGMLDNIEKDKSPLKEKLNSLGKVLVVICLIICIVVTVVGIMRGNNKYEMLLLGVSLAVAAIPEGLPAIVTVSLALGVFRMLKKNALVRRLPAVETLGCTSIICSDKTGTLTENKMKVKEVFYNNVLKALGEEKIIKDEIFRKIITYCNDCNLDFSQKDINKGVFGDPTEVALIRACFKNTKELKSILDKGKKIYEEPFDSNRKIMSVVVKEGGKNTLYIKGAPERIIERCKYINISGKIEPLKESHKKDILKAVESMSLKALRCIAVGYKPIEGANFRENNLEKDIIFVGIAGMIDPPRKEVEDAVYKCRMAGIMPVMITGDHKNTAYAIGKELGIANSYEQVITGEELDKLSDRKLEKLIDNIKIFARVSPNHKLRIVKTFKKGNRVVAMTGDGVNDAPAVKEADIGISMGMTGTDVTKEASSMILLDDNFKTIVDAVEEGRVIYDNIRKFIRYLLSCNLGEVLTVFLASIMNLPTPLLPIQILFVNLATDGLPAMALGVDPADIDIMEQKPRGRDESIFSRGLKEKILIRGSLIGICTVLSFYMSYAYNMDLRTCRTIALSTLILSQLIHVFECRSERHSIFEIKYSTNIYLILAVAVSIVMLFCVIYIPFFQKTFHTSSITISQWFIVLFFSGIISFINSIYLLIKNKKR
ncbi:calcium-translocating P-type ATPase, PMCA-type [Clostridium cochlearium]|uniref:calcium-translocating P-type ATPase, PMCA-type n=1 Tax=Clostridium cochlearium TaxID=1494 RepID=UPI002149F83E|nr:calcium-translocating P-type ATPase, PMCA-type [Clostridium cochlearium]MCR1970364.1 calcium-translocating P-type ATPase, PMCA-type [Clostridium cochlearium]